MLHLGLTLATLLSTTGLANEPVNADEIPPEVTATELQLIRNRPSVLDPSRWHLHLAVGTNFPIDIGGQFTVEAPFGLRAHLGLGGMPQAYQNLAQSVAVSAGAYDEDLAATISTTLNAAFVLHAGLGLRPIPDKGFVFDVGYRLMRFDAQNTPNEIVAAIPGASVPMAWQSAAASEVRLTSMLHQVAVRGGWEWVAAKYMVFRLDVGGTFTLDTSHKLSASREVELPANADRRISVGEEWFDEQLKRYAHTPTIGFSVGYRF